MRCGYGTARLASTERVDSVTALDISREAINFARSHYPAGKTSFLTGNASRLPFRNHSFDFVTCFEVIEHVQNPVGLLQEISRTMKKDGRAMISSPNKIMSSPLQRVPPNPFHIREWYKDELADLIARHFTIEGVFGQMCFSPLRGILRAFVISRGAYEWFQGKLGGGRSKAGSHITGVAPEDYIRIKQIRWPKWTMVEGGTELPVCLIFLCRKGGTLRSA